MGQNEISRSQLIHRAAAGDRPSLELLLLQFHDPVLAYIRGSIPPGLSAVIAAEDLLQETLIAAFEGIAALEPRGERAFFAWLKTIARHRLINHINWHRAGKRDMGRRAVAPRGVDATTARSIFNLIAGTGPSPSRIAMKLESTEAISAAISRLEPSVREVVILRYGNGLSISDIGRRVNKSASAVKMIIHRAIKDLRLAVGVDEA